MGLEGHRPGPQLGSHGSKGRGVDDLGQHISKILGGGDVRHDKSDSSGGTAIDSDDEAQMKTIRYWEEQILLTVK